MTQRTAFIITIMVTSFVLVAVGGVTATIATRPASPPIEVTEAPAEVTVPTAVIGIDPAVVAERDAQYQQALAEANQQLQNAYKIQKNLADDLANPLPTATPKPRVFVQAAPTSVPAPAYPVSAQLAASLALNAAPGAVVLSTPELVLFAGVPAYEVILDRGKIYIDAMTGAVLYNGTSAPASTNGGGGGGNGGGTTGNNPAPTQPQTVSDDDGGSEGENRESENEDGEDSGGDEGGEGGEGGGGD